MKTKVLFKSKKDFYKLLSIVLLIIVMAQSILLIPQPPEEAHKKTLSQLPVSLEGYQEADVNTSVAIIYLTSGCSQLAMVTTDAQTYSIQNGIEKKVNLRPTTHDIFKDLVKSFGLSVKMVKITSLEDSIYYAKLYIQQGSSLVGLDAKPSDAIAIAVRFDAPIYINSEIMQENAKSIC